MIISAQIELDLLHSGQSIINLKVPKVYYKNYSNRVTKNKSNLFLQKKWFRMLGGYARDHVKEVKTTIEHVGLYLGLIAYTGVAAAVKHLFFYKFNAKFIWKLPNRL